MANSNRRSLLDRLLAGSVSILVAAGALFVAVRLLEAVWTALLVILLVGLFLVAAVALVRVRHRGW